MKTAVYRRTFILCIVLIRMGSCMVEAQSTGLHEDLAVIQHCLKADEALLEYLLTDSSVQITTITPTSTHLTIQSLDQLFWWSLKSFRNKLTSGEFHNFSIPGELLYMVLIKPVVNFLPEKRRLIIIPGESLYGLPFEAFVNIDSLYSVKSGYNHRYLIHDFEIVYHSSLECWSEVVAGRDNQHFSSAANDRVSFIGFSPEFQQSKYLAALPGSKKEIAQIGALFRQKGLSSRMFNDEHVDKEHFTTIAPKGRIVHLATHYLACKADLSDGGFPFSCYHPDKGKKHDPEDLLTLDDIKSLQLTADLVVLNGCATGVDKHKHAGASNSLPMILFMAGARNIISTLWNVTDNLAERFMLDFYQAWFSGKTYSEALRQVKLQWISCKSTAIPTIWAPYILTGE